MTTTSAAEKLDTKDQAIIPIAAFTANGDVSKLKISLNEGLESGLTINEIKEVLIQMYAYAGFPRSLNGLSTFMAVLDERKEKGITDIVGRDSKPLPTDQNSLEFGTDNQTKLIGTEVKGTLFEFSPEIDTYLKAHLFGDIFERDTLSWKQRELATIAALASLEGVNSQLSSHYNISMNNHVSVSELKDFISVIEKHHGTQIAENAQQVLNTVLENKSASQDQYLSRDNSITKKGDKLMKKNTSTSLATSGEDDTGQQLYRAKDLQSFEGPNNLFTGKVNVDVVFPENDIANYSAAYVTFQPSARSAWHTHPAGQHMIVTKGVAITGTRDGKVLHFHEGESVWCPPDIDHWHGATPDAAMTHLVITASKDGESVTWKEKVTDEQYEAAGQ